MRGVEIRNNDVQISISTQLSIYRWYMSEALRNKQNGKKIQG